MDNTEVFFKLGQAAIGGVHVGYGEDDCQDKAQTSIIQP
jgi:hypothetical protein